MENKELITTIQLSAKIQERIGKYRKDKGLNKQAAMITLIDQKLKDEGY